jgi:D-inositol-3-phosphate glycosyltransferase
VNSLKIAILSIHSCPLGQLGTRDTGGMNVYVCELSRQLGSMGHRVDIFTRAHDPRDAEVEEPFENVRLIHIKAGKIEDMGKIAQLSHLHEFKTNMSIYAAADRTKYDVIHSHYWLSGLVGNFFSAAWDIPHVVMFHTVGALKNLLSVGAPEPPERIKAEKELISRSGKIVAATETERLQLQAHFGAEPDKISVVPCGVNSELFRNLSQYESRSFLGLCNDDKIILSVGRIEPLKGFDRLITAVARLNQRNIKLIIVGGDAYSEAELRRLKRIASNLGIETQVSFAGTVNQKLLPHYYCAADATVVSSYYESFCLIILESLSCGTPVVSTNVGIGPVVIEDGLNGYVVRSEQIQELTEAIQRAITEPRLLSDASSIRESVSEYNWPSVAAGIGDVYSEAIAEHKFDALQTSWI